MTITVETLVAREVHYCVSFLVSTLAEGCGATAGHSLPRGGTRLAINDLTEQALELASPIDDWEEPAREAGWEPTPDDAEIQKHGNDSTCFGADRWQAACEHEGLDPYQREVFEHWIVSDWLADRLAEKGEKVDKDFAGLTVWARTTTGQGIANDSVIIAIHADLVGEA